MMPFSQELQYGPLWDDGETIILHDPPARLRGAPPSRFALGALWQVTPIAVELMDEQSLQLIASRVLEPLRSAPVGTVLSGHMMIRATTSIAAWESQRQLCDEREQIKLDAIRAGLSHHVRDWRHTLSAITTFVALRVPLRVAKAGEIYAVLAAQYPAFVALCENLERYYGGLRMRPTRLRAQGIIDALALCLNPMAPGDAPRLDSRLPLSQQVLTASPEMAQNGVRMGHEADASILSAIRYPGELTLGALSSPRAAQRDAPRFAPWTWSDYPVYISVEAVARDQHALLSYTDKRQAFTLSQQDSRKQDAVTDASVASKPLAQTVADLRSGVVYVDVSTQVVLWYPPGEGLGLQLQAQTAARDVQIEPYVEDMMAGDLFLRALPLGYNSEFPADADICHSEPVRAAYAGGLMPLYGGYAGARREHSSYVVSSRDEGVTVDLFDTLPPHMLIVGRTRSGKSIGANWLASDLLDRGGTVFILDVYGSYNGLAEAYGGVVKTVSPSETVSFGLFDGSLDAHHRAAIVNVMAELFVAQGDPPLGATEIAYLTQFVRDFARYWRTDHVGECCTVSRFLDYQDRLPPSDASEFSRRLSIILSMYARDGEYAAFVDGPNELPMGHGLTVLDVAGLKNTPWLRVLSTLTFFHRADTYIQDPANLGRRKVLICDEAWGALRSPQAAEAIDSYIRAYARFNAALVMMTQNPSDLEGAIGQSLIDNVGQVWLFYLSSLKEAELVAKTLGMAPHVPEMITSLINPYEYDEIDMSEGLIFRPNDAGGDGGLFRLVAPPAWLARVGRSRQHQEEMSDA